MSRTDKITRMLSMHYQLLTDKPINKQTFCVEHGITARSFDRDIEDLRLYLSDELSYCELKYDRQNNEYYLTSKLGENMPADVSFFLVDLLFSIKIINKDEMEGVLLSILKATESHRNLELHDYILERLEQKSNWGNVAILKMYRDLKNVIAAKRNVSINYEESDNEMTKYNVCPIDLKNSNGYIYLEAYINEVQKEQMEYFRVDRIKSFVLL